MSNNTQAPTGQPEAEGGVTAFQQGDRVLWIPHNHTGYISEVDERDGLPCYYLELDNSDETGYAKHESLKLVGGDCRIYPKEPTEIDTLRAQLAASLEREKALREALKYPAQVWNNWLYDRQIKSVEKTLLFSQWLINNLDVGQLGHIFKQAAEALAASAEGG